MKDYSIDVSRDVYKRLEERRLDGETVSDVIQRLLDGTTQMEHIAEQTRTQTSHGLHARQQEAINEFESMSEE